MKTAVRPSRWHHVYNRALAVYYLRLVGISRAQSDIKERQVVKSAPVTLAMVFKLLGAHRKAGRRLDGHNQLPKLVLGVTFNDGVEVIAKPTDRQPATAAA